jgi:hypothetical protein
MSRPADPPEREVDPSVEGRTDKAGAEEVGGEGRAEAAGRGGQQPQGGGAPKTATASKGINPVQHSE